MSLLWDLKDIHKNAGLGYIVNEASLDSISACANGLRNGENNVFLHAGGGITEEIINHAIELDVPIELWTVNTESSLLNMHPYVSGVSSDNLHAGKVLYNNATS